VDSLLLYLQVTIAGSQEPLQFLMNGYLHSKKCLSEGSDIDLLAHRNQCSQTNLHAEVFYLMRSTLVGMADKQFDRVIA
jgi:hypothetical protein